LTSQSNHWAGWQSDLSDSAGNHFGSRMLDIATEQRRTRTGCGSVQPTYVRWATQPNNYEVCCVKRVRDHQPPVQLHTLGDRAGRYAPPHGQHVVGSKRLRTGCRHERHNDPALTVIVVGRVERLLVDGGGCRQQGRRRERGLPIATQRSREQTYIINQTIWTHYPCGHKYSQPSSPSHLESEGRDARFAKGVR
jgi:hypothetical protein